MHGIEIRNSADTQTVIDRNVRHEESMKQKAEPNVKLERRERIHIHIKRPRQLSIDQL